MLTMEELINIRPAIPFNQLKSLQVQAPTKAMLEHLQSMGKGAKLMAALVDKSQKSISDATIRRLFK